MLNSISLNVHLCPYRWHVLLAISTIPWSSLLRLLLNTGSLLYFGLVTSSQFSVPPTGMPSFPVLLISSILWPLSYHQHVCRWKATTTSLVKLVSLSEVHSCWSWWMQEMSRSQYLFHHPVVGHWLLSCPWIVLRLGFKCCSRFWQCCQLRDCQLTGILEGKDLSSGALPWLPYGHNFELLKEALGQYRVMRWNPGWHSIQLVGSSSPAEDSTHRCTTSMRLPTGSIWHWWSLEMGLTEPSSS